MAVSITLKPYTQASELRRLLFTLAQIKRRQYQQGDFLLLTPPLPKNTSTVLINENLLDHLSRRFDWKNLDADLWYRHYLTADTTPYQSLTQFLPQATRLNLDQTKLTQAVKLVSDLLGIKNLKLCLYPSTLGTCVSFRPQEKHAVTLFVRADATNLNLIRAIIGSLLRNTNPNLDWALYQQIQDFLATKTVIKTILNLHPPVKPPTIDPQFTSQSRANYARLGYPTTKALTLNGKTILLHDQPITFLSASEYQLLYLLLKHEGETIDYDQIGCVLWPHQPDKFSLQAISKSVERLRHQLQLANLRQPVIFTYRHQGYQLVQ